MQDRDEKVVQAWQRRLRRQEWISRLTVVVVLGLIATKVVAKWSLSHGARTALGLVLLALVAWVVFALVFSFAGLRCPKCNAYQGRRLGERDRISLRGRGPTSCRACHTAFV